MGERGKSCVATNSLPELSPMISHARAAGEIWLWGVDGMDGSLPKCQKCKSGDLVPLSDFGSGGAPIHYKAWVCTNPECGFNIKIRNGDVYMNEPIGNANFHPTRSARFS